MAGPGGAPDAALPRPEPFADATVAPAVRGVRHRPAGPAVMGRVLTHGAGSSAGAPLLERLAEALAGRGLAVLRCDLPFRQARSSGPPRRGDAARDREGLRHTVAALRSLVAGPLILGGHSYGGRQASLLCADEPALAAQLLLLAYPLRPPQRPDQARTEHFPRLRTPTLFVHGTRDPFGSLDALEHARALIPARSALVPVEGAGHDLHHAQRPGARGAAVVEQIALALLEFVEDCAR